MIWDTGAEVWDAGGELWDADAPLTSPVRRTRYVAFNT